MTHHSNADIIWERFESRVFYYPKGDKNYYYLSPSETWIPLSEKTLWNQMLAEGLLDQLEIEEIKTDGEVDKGATKKLRKAEGKWAMDGFLAKVREHNIVTLIGEIAGFPRGRVYQGGEPILVLRGMKLPPPTPGDWSFIRQIMNTLFDDQQRDYVLAWLQHSYLSLKSRRSSFSQIMIIVGDSQDGKSLFQSQIVSGILGGRDADATRYLTGDTPFNYELAGAEHWIVEDQTENKFYSRKSFSDGLKKISATPSLRIEGKGVNAVNVARNQRCTVTMNSGSRNVSLLPELSRDLKDKLLVLKSSKVEGLGSVWENNQKIKAEIPAFVDFLVNVYRAPEEIVGDERFRVRAFVHPDIVEAIHETSGSFHLGGIIEEHFRSSIDFEGIFFSGELFNELHKSTHTSRMLEKICKHVNYFGQMLTELTSHRPDLVTRGCRGNRGYRFTVRVAADPRAQKVVQTTQIR